MGNHLFSSLIKVKNIPSNAAPIASKPRSHREKLGYGLLLISILASGATFISSQFRPKFYAFQLTAPVGSNTSITPSEVRRIQLSSSNKAVDTQFASLSQITHLLTLHRIPKGQLIELSDLAKNSGRSIPKMEMTIPLNPDQAPLASISPGNYIRIIDTVGSGQSATSMVVAQGVKVLGIVNNNHAIAASSQNSAEIEVSLSNPIESIAIAQAEATGKLTVLLVSGPNVPDFQGAYSLSGNPAANTPPYISPPA